MSFIDLNLNENIQKALDNCGYTQPTPIQEKAIPVVIEGKDLVACAQTGTGKTAAFVLPALQRLSLQKPSRHTKILILTPTRELAAQITTAAARYGKFLQFKVVSLVGGMSYHTQIRDLDRGADIIVATPGRLLDHIQSDRVDLSQVEMLVLDEADRMLDMGFIDDVQEIASMMPKKRQTLLFSATADKQLTSIIRQLLNNPTWIDLSEKEIASPNIKQEVYKATNQHHKIRMLRHFLNDKNIFKAIIFSATKMNADKLATQLRNEGYPAAALHGDLRQNVRNRTIEQLRRGKIQFLVATDVAARGIDINDVTHVINYDMPRFCEDYVHRIGRTGRAGKSGTAISFVTSIDAKHLQRIERYIGQRLKVVNNLEGAEASERPDHFQPIEDEPRGRDSRGSRRFKSGEGKPRFNDDDRGNKRSFSERRHSFGDDSRASNKPFSSERRRRSGEDDHRSGSRASSRPLLSRKSFTDEDSRPTKASLADKRKRFTDDNKKSFASDERKRFSDDDGRPSKSFSSDKRKRFSDDDGRPSKSFSSDKRKRFNDDDGRPSKSFSSDKRKRFGDDDNRPSKSFSSDKRKRFGDDDSRPRKSFSSDKRKRFGDDDGRPSKSFSSDKRKRFGNDESRPSKSFSSDKRKRFGDDESRPKGKSFSPDKRKRFSDDDSRPKTVKRFGDSESRASGVPFTPVKRKRLGDDSRGSKKPSFGAKKRHPLAGPAPRKKERSDK